MSEWDEFGDRLWLKLPHWAIDLVFDDGCSLYRISRDSVPVAWFDSLDEAKAFCE